MCYLGKLLKRFLFRKHYDNIEELKTMVMLNVIELLLKEICAVSVKGRSAKVHGSFRGYSLDTETLRIC